MRTHGQSVQDQFDPQAQAYLSSKVHAGGPDMVRAVSLVGGSLETAAIALDLGCGAGHLSFRLAPLVGRMVALDPSPAMLATVARVAAERGLPNLETRAGQAESVPFPEATFDLIATRYSAHHWMRLEAALREIVRVAKPGAWLLLIDSLAPEEPLVDTHLQSIELLRDRSHVRNRSASQWRALLQASGFKLIEQQQWPTRIEFAPWVERMRTPALHIAAIRSLQSQAPSEVQQALGLESDGTFVLQTGLLWAQLSG